MAQSLVKLTLESNQYEKGLKDAQKSLSDFTRAIGLNMKSLSGMAVAAGVVTSAIKVAKDAFFKNEQQLDEWGRTVEASKSLYSGFLNSINNGDISGFLNNINNITEAARAAYDALDELSTFNAFNQIQTQKTRTGFTEAMAGYRMGESSKEDVQKAAKAYQEELRNRQKKEQEAYRQAVRKVAAERGVSWGGLEQALSGKYGDYEKLKNTMPTGKRTVTYGGGMFGGGGSYEVPMAVTVQEKMGEALRKLNDTELKDLQALGAQAYKTSEEIAQIDKQMARVLNGKQGGSGGGGGRSSKSGSGSGGKIELTEMQQNQKTINDLTQEYVRISDDASEETRVRQEEIRKEIQLLQQRNNLLKLYQEQAQGKLQGGDIQTTGLGSGSIAGSFKNIKIEGLDDKKMEKVRKGMAKLTDSANESKVAMGLAASAANSLGAAFGNMEDPGAKAAGMVVSAIASIALGFAQAAAAKDTVASGWGWLVWVVAGLAAMATSIATVHNLTGYAQGGIVKGNSYSGDNIYGGPDAMVNAGELVLTRAQQSTLASALQGNGLQNMNIAGRIKGTDIILSIDRSLKLEGKQLLTWGR